MKNLIKMECYRAFCSKKFIVILMIGCVINITHVLQKYLSTTLISAADCERMNIYPSSVFNKWIGFDATSLQFAIFFMIVPILAAFPYGDSYFTDNQGYIKNVITRSKKKKYFIAKFIATFLSGGTVIIIPLLLSLLSTMVLYPSLKPEPIAGTFSIYAVNLWSNIFLEMPYVYILLYLLLDFVFCGLLAAACMGFSYFVSNRYLVTICPFAICLAIFAAFQKLGIAPYTFLAPYQTYPANPVVIVTEIIIMFFFIGYTLWRKGIKKDVF